MGNGNKRKEYNVYIVAFEDDKRIMLEIRKSDGEPDEIVRIFFDDFDSFSKFVDGIADGRDKLRDEIAKIINDHS